jgi:hypothetical protein
MHVMLSASRSISTIVSETLTDPKSTLGYGASVAVAQGIMTRGNGKLSFQTASSVLLKQKNGQPLKLSIFLLDVYMLIFLPRQAQP